MSLPKTAEAATAAFLAKDQIRIVGFVVTEVAMYLAPSSAIH